MFLCIYIQLALDPSLNLVQHHHHQAPASLLCILYPGHLDVWLGNTQPMLTLKFNKILSIVIINEKKKQQPKNQSWEIRESTDVYRSFLQFSMLRKPPIKNVIASFAISSLSSVLSSRTSTNKTSSVSFRSCLRLDTARSISA